MYPLSDRGTHNAAWSLCVGRTTHAAVLKRALLLIAADAQGHTLLSLSMRHVQFFVRAVADPPEFIASTCGFDMFVQCSTARRATACPECSSW